jgi:riboflavin synthase
MFTGIIREIGEIEAVRRKGGSLVLRVRCPETAAGAVAGDSIAVDGVCLTATTVSGGSVGMDVGEETFSRTTLADARAGARVNVEPSLRVGDKLGGHFVAGHVDGVGAIVSVTPAATQITVAIRFPRELARFVAPKGSVAVDGISLTAGAVRGDTFEVYVIPHTLGATTLGGKRAGAAVNVEADVLARYTANALKYNEDGGERLLGKLKDHDYFG